jgi:hypothetical protein
VPDSAGETVEARLAQLDAALEFGLDFECPACAHKWRSVFDIAGYFWTEIADAAKRLMGEVHELAQAYGWNEREILALSPRRRRAYLGLVRGE